MSSDPQKCIIDSFGGHTHPYAYCIKPLDQMVDYNDLKGANSMNLTALEAYAGGAINYASSLVSNPTNALADECKNKLGNKYFLKTQSVCSNGEPLHKYINNMDYFNIITRRRSSGNDGIIPAAISSITRINAMGIFNAIVGESVPECIKVNAPCHIVHEESDSANNYFGNSPDVWISKTDYDEMLNEASDITEVQQTESLTDLSGSDVSDTTEEFCNQYINKINDINANFSKFNNNKFSKDIISNMYILSIILFLLFITYKLMHKK
tara:strand:- start:505 stop:1305 length:801 start_codon:yes stop_codon:yes gene_type:complete